MSRVSKAPISLPKGVEVTIEAGAISVTGKGGSLRHELHQDVTVVREGDVLQCSANDGCINSNALAGTTRSLVQNMVTGVSDGFERKLQLIGVGYRAQMTGSTLNLALGYSHPIDFPAPDGVSIETPTQTEIVVKGIDKQRVGQTAAIIRGFRPPEPYKGKGVRYSDENVVRKEAKKK